MIDNHEMRINCVDCKFSVLEDRDLKCAFIGSPYYAEEVAHSWSCDHGSPTENNQTAKSDAGKPELTLVPRAIIWQIAQIRMYGNKKYHDPENWKQVETERYKNAAFRHFLAYLDDPHGVDEESKLPHLWHLACNIAFLCERYNEDS